MAQEIYHRSNWGIASNEWGSTYLNADLTNELYKRAGYYENSWATDKILNKIGTKPSIILTPTAYEDGKLNSVKPAKILGSELVVNGGFDTDSGWIKGTGWTIANGSATSDASTNSYLNQQVYEIGKKYKLNFEVLEGTIELRSAQYSKGTGFYNTGTYSIEVIPTTTSTYFYVYTGFGQSSIDNVSVKEITDADFDFTRGSSATRVNEKGLVQDVQILSDELVQNGDFEQIGSELVTNGGFDTDSDWTLGNGSYISDASLILPNTGTALQTGVPNNTMVRFDVQGSGTIGYRVNTGVSYQQILLPQTIYLTTGSSGGRVQFSNTSGDEVTIDNVSVKEVGQNWTFGTGWSMGDGKAIYTGTTNSDLAQSGILTSGKLYKLQYEVINSTLVNGVVKLSGTTASAQNVLSQTVGTHTLYFTADGTMPTSFNIRIVLNTSGQFELDNISVIEITDDTDLPRIDYTDGEGSLLLEPQSTNLITYSEDFSQWNKTGNTSVSSNDSISPDGTLNASTVSGLTGSGSNDLRFSLSTNPANKTYTFIVYLKGEGTLRLHLSNNVDSTASSIVTLTSSWVRYELIHTFNSTSASLSAVLDDSGATASEYKIWGAQLEEGSYATSYIPTNGTTVTRLADVANNAGNSDLINSTEGVLYAEIMKVQENPDHYRLISLNNDASNSDANSVTLGFNNNTDDFYVRIKANNTNILQNYQISSNKNQFYKIAVKYKSGDCALWIDGVEQDTSTTTFAFAQTLDNLSFDYNGNGILPFYGNVKCVAVFKEALSDEELHKLTSPYESFEQRVKADGGDIESLNCIPRIYR